MPIYRLGSLQPLIASTAYVHPDAVIIGDVQIGGEASVWPAAVLRGDFGRIRIGERTNIQDGAVVHAGESGTTVGDHTLVGHSAILESCRIEDRCFIAAGAMVLRGAVVRSGGAVAAGAVLLDGYEVPTGLRAQGIPAVVVQRPVDAASLARGIAQYQAMAARYARELERLD
jgi:carbonic anhydrase/acetyltransferase-like protein (isoleucine patch superfamily)